MPWKLIYVPLLTCSIDHLSFSSIGQAVFDQWSFKVLKSTRSIDNFYIICYTANNRAYSEEYIQSSCLHHFYHLVIRRDSSISWGHKYQDNTCPPLSSPMVDFNIEPYGETFQDRVISSHWHNVKASNPKDSFTLKNSLKYDPKQITFSLQLCKCVLLINKDKIQKVEACHFQNKSTWPL